MAWDSRSESWVGTFSLDQCDDPDGRLRGENSSVINMGLHIPTQNAQPKPDQMKECLWDGSVSAPFLSASLNCRVGSCHLPPSLTRVLFKPPICQSKKQQSISNGGTCPAETWLSFSLGPAQGGMWGHCSARGPREGVVPSPVPLPFCTRAQASGQRSAASWHAVG